MKKEFLEAGQIVSTHGVAGELRLQPWCDSPEFLRQFSTLYLDQKPVTVSSVRPNKSMAILKLDGVDDVEAAMKLKGKVLFFKRDDAALAPGTHFISELYGLTAVDAATGAELGRVVDVLTPSAQSVYVIRGGGKEYLVPAVKDFILDTDVDAGVMKVHLIEGMES